MNFARNMTCRSMIVGFSLLLLLGCKKDSETPEAPEQGEGMTKEGNEGNTSTASEGSATGPGGTTAAEGGASSDSATGGDTGSAVVATGTAAAVSGGPTPPDAPQPPSGLQVTLSGVEPEDEAPESLPIAETQALTEEKSQAILARLPPLESEQGDRPDFAFRERSLPAPRTGDTIETAFPPPLPTDAATPEVAVEALEVLRYAPEGELPATRNVSVTFSQPMVAVTSHDDLAREALPVRIQPEPPGQWRWVGTRTLLFEPTGRVPMATEFRLEVPAGTRSANGGVLAEALQWSFRTPPPRVVAESPRMSPIGTEPVIALRFDQQIDPELVLATVQLTAGRERVAIRLATAEEIAGDAGARRLRSAVGADRTLVFRPVEALPVDTQITWTVGPGTPSMEGPRTSTEAHRHSLRTYGPLQVTESRCGWRDNCPPFTPWRIEFSNSLDRESFDSDLIRIDPPVEGLVVENFGSNLRLRGRTKGRTRYEVTLPAGLKDMFGQTLGEETTVTFNVGDARPHLSAQGGGLVVLDPAAKPTWSIQTVNYDEVWVTMYRVTADDWHRYQEFARRAHQVRNPPVPPGEKLSRERVRIEGARDELVDTALDLSAAFPNDLGQVVIEVEPTTATTSTYRRSVVVSWVQRTQLGISAYRDPDELRVWVTSLADGKPVEGATTQIRPMNTHGLSDAEGMATMTLPLRVPGDRRSRVLRVQKGDDVAILPERTGRYGSSTNWKPYTVHPSLRWFVFDDRKLYKPGEKGRVKGWVRLLSGGDTPTLGPVPFAAETRSLSIKWQLKDARNNDVAEGVAPLNALGGFDLEFELSDTINLGHARFEMSIQGPVNASGKSTRHTIQVQEFRRPEFEVKSSVSEGPHFVGANASVTMKASYFAGGGLPGTPVNWGVSSHLTSYTPPNRGDFSFGTWVAWWRSHHGNTPNAVRHQMEGLTDALGSHTLGLAFDSVYPPRPASVTVDATIQDVNRQTWTASSSLMVHPADHYVGLRSARAFIKAGETLDIELIVTDIEGAAVSGRPIDVQAVRSAWEHVSGEWKEVEKERHSCQVTSTEEVVHCLFRPAEGGSLRVTAAIKDETGRANESARTFWVAGGKSPSKRTLEQEELTLIPDRPLYQPGDTAEILVMSPFEGAEGLLTVRVSGIVHTERFRMEGGSHTLRIPIVEDYMPDVRLVVDLAGAAVRTGADGAPDDTVPARPAYAKGTLSLKVPPLSRVLQLEATPQAPVLEPGGATTVDLTVRDAVGRPVAGAEIAVVVVDEAVLALTGYQMADPMNTFYQSRPYSGREHYLRSHVLLADLAELSLPEPGSDDGAFGSGSGAPGNTRSRGMAPPPSAAPMAAMESEAMDEDSENGEGGGQEGGIQLRSNFDALAVFAPAVPTDASGRASVPVQLPDNLSRYRVMAVAVSGGTQFGSADSTITARLPLMVRPSAPRFLNFGDRFELPVVLQNQTDEDMRVEVAARALGVAFTEGAGRQLVIPANNRVEVRLPAAVSHVGTARFQVGASAGSWSDAAMFNLPVWTPATTEAFATYGEVDEGAIRQPVRAPSNVVPAFGGLEITTSSTALQALTDAVLYLVAYPYECSEQLSSRVMAVAALKDVLGAFDAEGLPSPEEMIAAVSRDLERLRGIQNYDGGFAFWRAGRPSWPYLTVHVTHAMARAKAKGFEVPERMLSKAQRYLQQIERHFPPEYKPPIRRVITAYSLYVRNLLGEPDVAKAHAIIREAGGLTGLSLEAIGWLWPVLSGDQGSAEQVAAIRRYVTNRVTETAGNAHFVTSYSDGAHFILHSSRRADGLLLEALIGDVPDSDLIPKLVRGLLAHRKRGAWGNTQENAFVLLALDRYFNTYEKETPDFVARVWLGEKYAGEHRFQGRTTDRQRIDIPMSVVLEQEGDQPLVLGKTGPGRLYYRIGMKYAPADLKLEAADHGFVVERLYEAVDEPGDVRRDDAGVWHVKAGARVRVRLTMAAPARRYHVALVDPLPAGLEPINGELQGAADTPPEIASTDDESGRSRRFHRWWGPWYEHQNLRDERAEAFSSLVWGGVYTYSYVARATTPGEFVVPPTKAEEMYAPETFGRSASDRLVVE